VEEDELELEDSTGAVNWDGFQWLDLSREIKVVDEDSVVSLEKVGTVKEKAAADSEDDEDDEDDEDEDDGDDEETAEMCQSLSTTWGAGAEKVSTVYGAEAEAEDELEDDDEDELEDDDDDEDAAGADHCHPLSA